MKTSITFLIIYIPILIFSQGLNEKYYFNMKAAYGSSFIQNQDQNSLISFMGTVADTFLPMKYRLFLANMQGDNLYVKISQAPENRLDWCYTVSKIGNNYIASGVYGDTLVLLAKGIIIKFNSNLDTLLYRKIGIGEAHIEYYPTSHILENNYIYLTCLRDSLDNQNQYSKKKEVVTICMDTLFQEIWRKKKSVPQWQGYTNYITKKGNKIIVAGGLSKYVPSGNVNKEEFKSMILLYDISGVFLDEYFSPLGEDIGYANSVIPTVDGGYIYCGTKYYAFIPSGSVYYEYDGKGYICKLDANLNKVWGLTVGIHAAANYTKLNKLLATNDGNYIAVGEELLYLPDSIQVDSGRIDGWAIKFNNQGHILWQRHFRNVYKGDNQLQIPEHFFNDIQQTTNDSLLMLGVVYPYSQDLPVGTYAWLLKTDSLGCLVPGCETVGISPSTSLQDHIKLYPNPAQNELYLYFHTEKQPTGTSFRIWNMQGQEMIGETLLQNSTTHILRIADWVKGLYFVEVRDKVGNIYTEKFVKE